MTTTAERIIGIYERHAGAWVSARLREGSLYERAWLDRFCGPIPQRSSVLDLGCGAGAPIAKYLISPFPCLDSFTRPSDTAGDKGHKDKGRGVGAIVLLAGYTQGEGF
jgi:hypothetical protein